MEDFQESYELPSSELELLCSFVCKDIFDFICSSDGHSEFESSIQAPSNEMSLHPTGVCKPKRLQSFAAPKSVDDIAKAKRSAIPNKTQSTASPFGVTGANIVQLILKELFHP